MNLQMNNHLLLSTVYFLALLYIFTSYRFWNLCNLSRSLLDLTFCAPIFFPARVVTGKSVFNTDSNRGDYLQV